MPLKLPASIAATAAAAVLLLPVLSLADVFEEERLGYTFHMFTDVDGVNVFTHYGSAGIDMTNRMKLMFQWTHDTVVIPGIEAPPGSQEAVDAITTASRPIVGGSDPYEDFVKDRNEVQASMGYYGGRVTYYVSSESDYFAQMVTLTYNRDFAHDNLNLSGAVSYGWDDIRPLQDDDTATGDDHQNTWYANVVATQILTPTTVARAGAEYFGVEGLQHDPYRNVYVAGSNVPEAHPRERSRWALFMNVSQYITNRSSVKLDYRYYQDDWGISSHTIGGKLNQYVTDQIVVRYRYRYYTQTPAGFYRDDYTDPGGVDGYQTGDYRLGDYGAHLFGGHLLWFPHGFLQSVGFVKGAHLVFSYEHYFNSNNFSANVYETGLRITF